MSIYDAVIVGGGHNGLTAAAYLALAGRSVLVLERGPVLGGAAVSAEVFPGHDARVSRYAYLVSLLPRRIVEDLGLRVELRRRRVASYTPVGDGGVLVDDGDAAATAASLGADHDAWERFYAMTRHVARRVFPTLLEPLHPREDIRALVDDDAAWSALFERPIGEAIEAAFTRDEVRGIVLTDALIGTFAAAHDPSLAQNRCFLYHVIGGGTGDWDVPVGGMGAVSRALAVAAQRAGAELRTGTEVVEIDPEGAVRTADGTVHAARRILVGAAPATMHRLLGEAAPEPAPEGAQLKVNMLLARLPRLRDPAVTPEQAFAGTLHVNEGYAQLERAYAQASRGDIPSLPPCEVYCHSLTDPSILGPELRERGAQTLTLFGLHMPARLFADPASRAARKAEALGATLRSLDAVLAEPIEDCVLDGCVEAKVPQDLEDELALPGGNIFHGDLSWPYGERGRWGVETHHERVLLCGAGARRGGGVSGIGGHNAAMAVLTGG
jgi:phytoene dehydrogenase-like protein